MGKFKIVVSDLHLGAGFADEGNPLEDFDQDEAFAELLSHMAAESERLEQPLELIFAGDSFEFLQVPALGVGEAFEPARSYPVQRYEPTDEASSRRKMALMILGHPLFFRALREFISSPLHSICFVKGNHDINLHWGQVQAAIRAAVGAEAGSAGRLRFEERCVSREGIYVEHGNQYLEWLNRWPDFEQPHDPKDPLALYMPAGSRFVYQFFNELERQHYWLDGIKPITALIWYLFALDYGTALRALRTLLRLLPSLLWGSLPVGWSITESMEAFEQVNQVLSDERRMAALDTSLKERSVFYNQVDIALDLYGVQRVGGPLGRFGVYGHSVLPRGQDEQQAQRDRLRQIAEARQAQEGAQVVVFGHVHEPCDVSLSNGAQYLNAGSWTWSRDMTRADHAAWLDLFRDPDRYMDSRRLTYVRIDYDDHDVPSAELRTFVLDAAPRLTLWHRFREWVASRQD